MTDEKETRRNITLNDDLAEKARRIGGDVSKGIRKALLAYDGVEDLRLDAVNGLPDKLKTNKE
jgi:hypothetical protein